MTVFWSNSLNDFMQMSDQICWGQASHCQMQRDFLRSWTEEVTTILCLKCKLHNVVWYLQQYLINIVSSALQYIAKEQNCFTFLPSHLLKNLPDMIIACSGTFFNKVKSRKLGYVLIPLFVYLYPSVSSMEKPRVPKLEQKILLKALKGPGSTLC